MALSALSASDALANQACWNPQTGRLEPCLMNAKENAAAGMVAACYDPVTGRLEPCFFNLQRAENEQMADACIDPVTRRPEPCL
ncbi:MAG: hypothetical protein EBX52_07905 [Proteobacteria bacterium]|nr:hypothetical protein [Pseudomonadota bacterium]